MSSCCGSEAKPPATAATGCCGGDSAPAVAAAATGCCSQEAVAGGCCAVDTPASNAVSDPTAMTEVVRAGYAEVSKKAATRTAEEAAAAAELATRMGYTTEELAQIPEEANMGLQCGNAVSLAALQPGETVVDLGSGGGFDIFLAARRVGPTGRAIGIDMTPEMVEQARATAARRGFTNTEFHLANIVAMPLPDNSVDCIISNCVINLAPDKNAVFREMFRVLKPGGRIAVSDVVLSNDQELPPSAKKSLTLLVGCVSGAITVDAYAGGLAAVGFKDVKINNGGQDLNGMWNPGKDSGCGGSGASCCAVNITDVDDEELKGIDLNKFVFSGKITATK